MICDNVCKIAHLSLWKTSFLFVFLLFIGDAFYFEILAPFLLYCHSRLWPIATPALIVNVVCLRFGTQLTSIINEHPSFHIFLPFVPTSATWHHSWAYAVLFTTEAEYVVMSEGAKEVIWLKGLLSEIAIVNYTPTLWSIMRAQLS